MVYFICKIPIQAQFVRNDKTKKDLVIIITKMVVAFI